MDSCIHKIKQFLNSLTDEEKKDVKDITFTIDITFNNNSNEKITRKLKFKGNLEEKYDNDSVPGGKW
jgi:hypothetical protein